jgi:predicted O-linked N-acetylglucosamine transferase (SPINDLY family)
VYLFSSLQESREDDFTAKVYKKLGANFVRIGMTLIQNRAEVRKRDIDVLVYLDIGMEPSTATWAAGRLAPVQVIYA